MQTSIRHSNTLIALAAVFGVIFALVAWDLAADYHQGVMLVHVVVESLVLTLSGGAMIVLMIQFFRQRRHLKTLSLNLSRTRLESRHWREQYHQTIQGLSRAIRKQFDSWGLSAAEAEIGLLLLKGLSLKEIAIIRGTAERTVREQARAVYRKADLPNRSALSAFFLEDLLPEAPEKA